MGQEVQMGRGKRKSGLSGMWGVPSWALPAMVCPYRMSAVSPRILALECVSILRGSARLRAGLALCSPCLHPLLLEWPGRIHHPGLGCMPTDLAFFRGGCQPLAGSAAGLGMGRRPVLRLGWGVGGCVLTFTPPGPDSLIWVYGAWGTVLYHLLG